MSAQDIDDIIVYKGEVMLAGWSESHNGGAKVTFFLPSAEALDAFRSLTVSKGKQAGHRMMCVLVELGDGELPVSQGDKRGGSLTKLAGMFCSQDRFRDWARRHDEDGWMRAEAIAMTGDPVRVAAEWIRLVCGVSSRSELDTNKAAERAFHEKIRIPYAKALEG